MVYGDLSATGLPTHYLIYLTNY